MHAAALQYVRKVSGMQKPPQVDEPAFTQAIAEVAATTERLLRSLHARGVARTREGEREKGRARWKQREQRMRATPRGGP